MYTLTAIFCESDKGIANGRCWSVTIGKYDTKNHALAAILRLKRQFSGSQAEIIDYTITNTTI